MARDIRLNEDDGFLRIDARRQIQSRNSADTLTEFLRVFRTFNVVVILATVDSFVILLKLHKLLESAQIIAYMYVSRRLNSGKYSFHR